MHYHQLDRLGSDSAKHLVVIKGGAVCVYDLSPNVKGVPFLGYIFGSKFNNLRRKINAYRVPAKPPGLNDGCSTSKEYVGNLFPFLRKSVKQLIRDLWDKITPVTCVMCPVPVPSFQYPQTVGYYIAVLFPPVQVHVV